MSYSADSIHSIFHPHLTQFSPHTHSLTYLHKELELEWVITLAESNPSITQVSNELILCARVLLHHLHLSQVPSTVAGSSKIELLENYADGKPVRLYRNSGLCTNLSNLAYLLSGAVEDYARMDKVQDELTHLLFILFNARTYPFNVAGEDVGEHTSRMMRSPQCAESYSAEFYERKTLYTNPLRCAFLEFLAIQPLTMSDSHYAHQLATFTLPISHTPR